MKKRNIFGFEISRAPKMPAFLKGANVQLADGRTISTDKAKKMTVELSEVTRRLTEQQIELWREANQRAIDVENPRRNGLYAIYADVMHDLHLKGAVRNRKLAVLSTPFKITKDGEKDVDLTKLMRKKWFKQFLNLAIDARFFGHSLIQFGDVNREADPKFMDTELIPRDHVIPEFRVFLQKMDDDIKKGISYIKPPYSLWCLEVGERKDLGELNSVAKEAISKKYVLQFWDQFAEMFGMPIRIAKTSSRNPKDAAKIEDMLENMGAAAWGVFPEGTTVEFQRDFRPDAYLVYDRRIDKANEEISKGILGQTMTMDDGSSLSQAQVHEGVADEIADADRDWLYDVINDDLIPFLVMHGFPLDGYEFEWDQTYTYSPKEMKEIEDMLLTHFDVDPEYFTDKYGVPINGKKEVVTGAETNLVAELAEVKKKAFPSWVMTMPGE